MIHAFFGKTEPNQMQEVGSGIYTIQADPGFTGRNGHNQNASRLDPACLLGY